MERLSYKNAMVVGGDIGLDALLADIYEHWERGEDFIVVFHAEGGRADGDYTQQELAAFCEAAPKIVFTPGPQRR